MTTPFMPPVGINTGALKPGILQRISLFRGGAQDTNSLTLAPIVKVATRAGFYHFFAENDALLTGSPQNPLTPVDYDTPASPGGMRISAGTFNSNLYRWGFQVFPLQQIAEFAARGEDITARAAFKLGGQAKQHHAKVLGAVLDTNGNFSATPASAGGAATPLQNEINALLIDLAKQGVDLNEGRWVATCNLNTANDMLQFNTVAQQGYALAYAGGTDTARTGATDMSQLKAWFLSKLICPLELVVLNQFLPTTGDTVGAPVIANGRLAIFKVAESYGDSGFVQTMTPDPNAALGQIYTYDVRQGLIGIGLHVESDYGITVLGGPANKWAACLTGVSL
jgi:hypothetical protein